MTRADRLLKRRMRRQLARKNILSELLYGQPSLMDELAKGIQAVADKALDEDEQWLDAPLTAEEEAQFAKTIPPLNGDAPPPSASSAEPGPQEPLEQEVVKLRGQT